MKTLIALYYVFFPAYPFLIFGLVLLILLIITIKFSIANKQYSHKFKWFWIGSGVFFGSFILVILNQELTQLFFRNIIPTLVLYIILPIGLIYNVFKTNETLNT